VFISNWVRLTDHDAQIIICNINMQNYNNYFYVSRKIDKFFGSDFKINLSYEFWSGIFTDDDVNTIFNNFMNTYLRIFFSSFPVRKF
jgi:hypothetical protein